MIRILLCVSRPVAQPDSSFFAKRDGHVSRERSPRGREAGQRRDDDEQRRNQREGQPIGRADAEEQAAQDARGGERRSMRSLSQIAGSKNYSSRCRIEGPN